MLNDTTESYASQKASNYDKIFKQNHRLQFADSLKDLKNLRKQLYSAAERFESSYDKNYQKQFVVQLSKDYIAKALVSTVDHLGSVADKLNKFLDEKANEFSATIIRFYCIEQRLSTFHEFIDTRGMSQQLLMIEATEHPKHYILPASKTSPFRKPKEVFRSSISSPPYNEQQPKQDKSFSIDFQASRKKSGPPLMRKQQPRVMMPSREQSPNPYSFSFTRVVPNKEAGRRSVSPFRFPLNWSGSDSKRPVSPSPVGKPRGPLEPGRAISACRRQDMTNRENEIESYTSRSKQLFRALVSGHNSAKETARKQIIKG